MAKRWNINGDTERTRRHVNRQIIHACNRGQSRYGLDLANGVTVSIVWMGEQRMGNGLPEQVEIACFDTNSSLYTDPSQRVRTSEVWDEFLPWGKDCQPLDVDVIEYVNVDSLPLYLDEASKWTRK